MYWYCSHHLKGMINTIDLLKETSNKDLSTLAKAAFELLKWRIFWEPHLQSVVSVILTSANDPNWRTRSATLTYLRTFMYRYNTYSKSSVYASDCSYVRG